MRKNLAYFSLALSLPLQDFSDHGILRYSFLVQGKSTPSHKSAAYAFRPNQKAHLVADSWKGMPLTTIGILALALAFHAWQHPHTARAAKVRTLIETQDKRSISHQAPLNSLGSCCCSLRDPFLKTQDLHFLETHLPLEFQVLLKSHNPDHHSYSNTGCLSSRRDRGGGTKQTVPQFFTKLECLSWEFGTERQK